MRRSHNLGPYAIETELDPGTLGARYASSFDGRRAVVECVSLRADGELFDRFVRHIEVLANIDHCHIVPLLDAGLDGERLYIVTPAPDETAVDAGPTDAAAAVVADVAAGVAELHRRGILHRNVQPRHIGWYDGVVKLGGLGLVDVLGVERTCGVGPIGGVLTMAPSIVRGAAATTGSDVYSLGAVLHLLSTGAALYPVDPSESLVQRLGRIGAQHVLLSPYLTSTLRVIISDAIDADECNTDEPLARLRAALSRYRHHETKEGNLP